MNVPTEEERAEVARKMIVLGMPESEAPRFIERYMVITSQPISGEGKVFEDGLSYRFHIYGLVSLTEPDGPWMEATEQETGEVVGYIQLWRVRVLAGDLQTWGELNWRPGTEVHIGTQGPVSVYHKEDAIARHGLELFSRMSTMGRPPRSGLISGSDEVVGAFARYRITHSGKRPTQEELAEFMGYSDSSTLKRYLRRNRHLIDWKELS